MKSITRATPLTLVSLVLLAACAASGPKIKVSKDPSANLASYKTYNFMQPLGTDRAGYESLVSSTLKDIANTELGARGYTLSDEPNFLVNFSGKLDEKLRVSESPGLGPPMGFGYYGYRAGYYQPWAGYNTVDVDQYTQGTLNLDVIDAASKRLVWESVAEGRVTEKAKDNVPAALRVVVPQMFAEFPAAAR